MGEACRWFHRDIAEGNLLVSGGELSTFIDFGTSGVGNPAYDLVIAWGMFTGESREAFRRVVGQDEGTWTRAPGAGSPGRRCSPSPRTPGPIR